MIKKIICFVLITLPALTKAEKIQIFEPSSVICTTKDTTISLIEIKKDYLIYDNKNSSSIKILNCNKVKIQNYIFYSFIFNSEVHTGNEFQKVLTYEVALFDSAKSELKTVRSETIDQIEKTSDSVISDFENSVKPTWSYSKSKDSVLLKIEIINKKEKIDPYFLLLNKKTNWFENVFIENIKQKTK